MKTRLLLLAMLIVLAMVPGPSRADTLDAIKQRGEMIVGMEAAYVPFEYFDNGKIVGYDTDIANAVAKRLGVKARFIDTAWDGIIPALYAEKFDVIMSAMTITKERAEKVMFSMPYADASNMILLRAKGDDIKAAEDLSGHAVGAQLGSAGAQVAKAFEAKLKGESKPGFTELKLYNHYPEAYLDLLNHRTDGVINSRSSLEVVMKDQPGKYRMIGGIQSLRAFFGIAVRKDEGALLSVVNAELAAMKSDGTLAKLQEKWFGAAMETPNAVPATLP